MKDTLGTVFGFVIGCGFVIFGILFPDHLSNYYVYQVTSYEAEIKALETRRAPREQIKQLKTELNEFKESIFGSMSRFVDIKSFGIVAGGAFAACLIAFPVSKAMRVIVFVYQAFGKDKVREDFLDVYNTVLELSAIRVSGELIPDEKIEAIENEMFREWVQDFISVDVVSEDMITEIIESEIEMYNYRAFEEIDVLKFLGATAPAFGMVGTVVGLILMLGAAASQGTRISDVMGAMSVALITTLYGVLVAQLVFLPVASKRYQLKESTIKLMEMIQEGILYLKRRELPDVIAQDLVIYLPKKLRKQIAEERLEAMKSGDLGL